MHKFILLKMFLMALYYGILNYTINNNLKFIVFLLNNIYYSLVIILYNKMYIVIDYLFNNKILGNLLKYSDCLINYTHILYIIIKYYHNSKNH